ncbi:DUF2809 domain-containing protein [Kitasatospora phosalacinea]|uniref:ribosomal maturation YjgA family protein n=1 Tax=Kitasatospora phosalacinea TaxID=2065 RepID=UPI000689D49D|nr:DUF2809 domain-containing protein [Kitasatospora phosalacinea]
MTARRKGAPGAPGSTPRRSADTPGERRARTGWLAGAGAVLLLGPVAPALVPGGAASLLGGALYTALLYTVLMAAAPRLGPWTAGGTALAASWAVELFQASGLPADLGRHSLLGRLVLGTTFDLTDLLGYALGAAALVAVHQLARRRARPARRFDAPEGKPEGG